jgi:hypothetical protein
MKKSMLMAVLALCSLSTAYAVDHSAHRGPASGASGGGATMGTCMKAKISNFSPDHLAKVIPESEVSFRVMNIEKPNQVSMTIKEIPVETSAEFKDPYFLVKAKLPASLRNTAARINVRIDAKAPHCEAEGGWLVLISE